MVTTDMILCTGVGCEQRKNCLRHLQPLGLVHTEVFKFPPCNEDGTECDKFIDFSKRFDDYYGEE